MGFSARPPADVRIDAPVAGGPGPVRPIATRAHQRLKRLPRLIPTQRLAIVVALTSPVWLLSDSTAGAWLAVGTVAAIMLAAVGDSVGAPPWREEELERVAAESLGLREEGALADDLRSRW